MDFPKFSTSRIWTLNWDTKGRDGPRLGSDLSRHWFFAVRGSRCRWAHNCGPVGGCNSIFFHPLTAKNKKSPHPMLVISMVFWDLIKRYWPHQKGKNATWSQGKLNGGPLNISENIADLRAFEFCYLTTLWPDLYVFKQRGGPIMAQWKIWPTASWLLLEKHWIYLRPTLIHSFHNLFRRCVRSITLRLVRMRG